MNDKFLWTDYYREFADRLLDYKDNRSGLIKKIQNVYQNIGIKLPKLEITGIPEDIDPFTVFGLFNKGISDSNRIRILNGFKSEFGINSSVPDKFDGIPILNNLKATFYRFKGVRASDDIQSLWNLFEAALKLDASNSEEDSRQFISAYNKVLTQSGIRWNITIGLYWIRPYKYLNLDSKNRSYLRNPKYTDVNLAAEIASIKNVPDGNEYLTTLNQCKEVFKTGNYPYRSFPELSYQAWITKEEPAAAGSGKKDTYTAEFIKWIRPVITALREMGGSGKPADVREKIIENEKLTNEEISAVRGKSQVNKFENEVAFARMYLVKSGFIDNRISGVWTLTEKGRTKEITDKLITEIVKNVRNENSPAPVQPNALGDDDIETPRYWIYAPGEGAALWNKFYQDGVMAIGWSEIGDLSAYASKEEIKQALRDKNNSESSYIQPGHMLWQFVQEMKPGDYVYVKKGRYEILGKGIIESDYEYNPDESEEYPNVRRVKWMEKGEWQISEMLPMKTLTEITNQPETVSKLNSLFENENDQSKEDEKVNIFPYYSEDDFLDEVYINGENYQHLVRALKSKKNVILEGAPGVGKTFAAKRLAYSIMGKKDADRVMMVQFHQSYSYEDFIMGFRPSKEGFELKTGAFYNFCKQAEIDSENDYFFIIDEINRGNLSRIFGELFMLIENDKRGSRNKLRLLYSDEMFFVPENVYIIGMMNTADRSLAMLDFALRRRFAFVDMKPGFSSEGFQNYQAELDDRKFDALVQKIQKLNTEISSDPSLGEGFCIGHSYLCNLRPEELEDGKLLDIVDFELIPMLKEYWFDEPEKVSHWSEELRSSVR